MSIGHPAHAALNEALQALGIEGAVRENTTAVIQMKLDTPRGVVVL
jgi:hypothetical protein